MRTCNWSCKWYYMKICWKYRHYRHGWFETTVYLYVNSVTARKSIVTNPSLSSHLCCRKSLLCIWYYIVSQWYRWRMVFRLCCLACCSVQVFCCYTWRHIGAFVATFCVTQCVLDTLSYLVRLHKITISKCQKRKYQQVLLPLLDSKHLLSPPWENNRCLSFLVLLQTNPCCISILTLSQRI